ncbi:MAG: Crp/Fnr family transcriptional regulator [Pseudomonadota bacterium]
MKDRTEPLAEIEVSNCLLDRLPKGLRADFLSQCEPVVLSFDSVLCEAGDLLEHAYFPIAGSVAMMQKIDTCGIFATENIGREGMLGAGLILGVHRVPQRALVKTTCTALRLDSRRFPQVLDKYPALHCILRCYLSFVIEGLSRSTGCVRYHDVGSRLARELLLYHDRILTDDLPLLIHRVLAEMLGVRRSSITVAASRLQRKGIIRYGRGMIRILDREALEAAACGCYQASIESYGRLIGPPSIG